MCGKPLSFTFKLEKQIVSRNVAGVIMDYLVP